MRESSKVTGLFALAKLLAHASHGVPIGEPTGCDLRWALDGGGGRQLLDFEYLNEEAWPIQRDDWPWLIAAGPGRTRGVRLDIATPTALTNALAGELTPSCAAGEADSATYSAAVHALRHAMRIDAVGPPGAGAR